MMDTSIHFDRSRLDAIKGVATFPRMIAPIEIAALLFEEARDLQYDRALRSFCEGPHRGVSVRSGSYTFPFRMLNLPDGVTVRGIASSSIRLGEIYYEKHGERGEQWGVLALGCDEKNQAHWFWILIWDHPQPNEPEVVTRELKDVDLAELMTPNGESRATLDMASVYGAFMDALNRHATYLQRAANSFIRRFERTSSRCVNIRRMLNDEIE